MKIYNYLIMFLLFFAVILFDNKLKHDYRVLDFSSNKICIDINKDTTKQSKECFDFKNITPLFIENTEKLTFLDKNSKIYFNLLINEFFKTKILMSKINITDGIIYSNNKDLNVVLLENGLAITDSPKYSKYQNYQILSYIIKKAKTKTFYLYNKKSLKYHKLDCKYGLSGKSIEYVEFLPEKAKPCKYCILNNTQNKKYEKLLNNYFQTPNFNIDDFEQKADFGNLKIYTTLPLQSKPQKTCQNDLCKALLYEINNAEKSIDMAIYDISNNHELFEAFKNAKNRNIKIQVVTDSGTKNTLTNPNLEKIKDYVDFFGYDGETKNGNDIKYAMHNKFIIFDDKKLFTGSANITNTCISDFNINTSLFVDNKELTDLYEKEFSNFKNKKYHSSKNKTNNNKNIKISPNIVLDVYFSPQDKFITTTMIPLINSAKTEILMPVFAFTHEGLAKALIDAKNRGVNVMVITDATMAVNNYSKVNYLRDNDIKVKVENFAGKIHTKILVLDGKYTVVGSMNFTKSGDVYNDENVLLINSEAVADYYRKFFFEIWKLIPDKYLTQTPSAESFDSIGSCFDGIDNDYDGKIDEQDSGCKNNYSTPNK